MEIHFVTEQEQRSTGDADSKIARFRGDLSCETRCCIEDREAYRAELRR
jgi:hypothetical protein